MTTTYDGGGWPQSVGESSAPYRSEIRDNEALSAAELVELAISPKVGMVGHLEAILRSRFQQQMNDAIDVAKQRLLLRDLASQVASDQQAPPSAPFDNPTQDARPRTAAGSKGDIDTEGLRPSDLVWLQILATRDPADVDERSARHLAVLEASAHAHAAVDPGTSDHLLATEVMRPIRRRYDIAEVEYELEQLRVADDYLNLPVEFSKNLGDAIQKETPQLSAAEAHLRGLAMIDRAEAERDEAHDHRVAELKSKLNELRKS